MTQRLYYTDPYVQEFSARVVRRIELEEGPGLVLDQTCFYPTSGGQRADSGVIAGRPVCDVLDRGEEVVHVLARAETDLPEPGDQIAGRIDWPRRFDHMQQHSGQHILSQAFLQAAGASTESFHMSETSSTIDIDLESPTQEQIAAAEDLANRIVFEDRPIRIDFVAAEAQAALELRKQSERTGTLRLVSITGFDRSACGGTHCTRTGEVGLIKVRRWERVRQRARIDFVCGGRALRDYRLRTEILTRAGQLFSVAESDLPEAIQRQQDAAQELRRRIGRLQDSLLESEASRAIRRAVRLPGCEVVRGVWDGLDMKQLNHLGSLILADAPGRIALLASRGEHQGLLLVARGSGLESPDMKEVIAEAASVAGGRGGGSGDRAQAGGCRNERLEEALDRAFALTSLAQTN
ncbi:MAG: alanine--tRNA ligase-related protein [Acidobacteriota bacterium]